MRAATDANNTITEGRDRETLHRDIRTNSAGRGWRSSQKTMTSCQKDAQSAPKIVARQLFLPFIEELIRTIYICHNYVKTVRFTCALEHDDSPP